MRNLSAFVRLAACGLAAASLSACGATAPGTTAVSTGSLGSASRDVLSMQTEASVAEQQIDAPLAKVWGALPEVFAGMAIPVGKSDPVLHVYGNEGFRIRQRLGTTRLSLLLECGTTQIGPNADSYEVLLTVLVGLKATSPATTSATVTVDASARPITINQAFSRCSSKGGIESKLLGLLKVAAAK